MASIGVGEVPGRRVVNRVQHRDEHGGLVVVSEEIVHLPEHLPWFSQADGRALQQRTAGHHEQRRRHTLARHVRDGQTDLAVIQEHNVEEVPANVARRFHAPEHLEIVPPRELCREDRLLHLARHVQLPLQRYQLVAGGERLLPRLHVLQRALYRHLQVIEVEWLGNEVERTAVHRGADVLHVSVGRDDDRTEIGVQLRYLGQQRQPIHLGHVDIRDHHVDLRIAVEHIERLDPVLGEDERVAPGPYVTPHPL